MYASKIRLSAASVVELPIIGALPSDRYILKSADGLGPTEIDVSITETIDAGGVYQGSRPQNREIVLLVGLNPDFAIGESAINLRSELYGLLTPGSPNATLIELIVDEMPLLYTTGYVKKLEIVPFNKDPEIQLTIACTTQYWEATDEIQLVPAIDINNMFSIVNAGSAEAGLYFEFTLTAAMSAWSMTMDNGAKIVLTKSFVAGDKIIIDSRPGLRQIYLVHGGQMTNAMYMMSPPSVWPMLHAGTNYFTVSTKSFNWQYIAYRPRFWGI